MFKKKLNTDVNLQKMKARLVAKGYKQTLGIYYLETLSPVVKPTTIRVILTFAMIYN